MRQLPVWLSGTRSRVELDLDLRPSDSICDQTGQDTRPQSMRPRLFLHDLKHRNIYLIGPMGSGKTAVGRQLASCCTSNFTIAMSRSSGAPVWISPTYSRSEGEAGFREREREVIDALTQLEEVDDRDRRRCGPATGEPGTTGSPRPCRLLADRHRTATGAHASRSPSPSAVHRRIPRSRCAN